VLGTQEWTSVPVEPGPIGRYGHAATMYETRFFVFGGQAEGAFMNDLWAYDIKQCGLPAFLALSTNLADNCSVRGEASMGADSDKQPCSTSKNGSCPGFASG